MGRRPTGTEPKQAIRYLQPIHHEIMRRLVKGQTQAQISRDLLISQARLSVICNSDVFKARYQQLKLLRDYNVVSEILDVESKVKLLSDQALDILADIMKDESATTNLRRMASKDILDFSKHINPKPSEDDATSNLSTAEMIMKAFEQGSQMRKNIQDETKNDQKTTTLDPADVNVEDAEIIDPKAKHLLEQKNEDYLADEDESLEDILEALAEADEEYEHQLELKQKEKEDIERETYNKLKSANENISIVDKLINEYSNTEIHTDPKQIEVLHNREELKNIKNSADYKKMLQVKKNLEMYNELQAGYDEEEDNE